MLQTHAGTYNDLKDRLYGCSSLLHYGLKKKTDSYEKVEKQLKDFIYLFWTVSYLE